jgi:hypothetical protein
MFNAPGAMLTARLLAGKSYPPPRVDSPPRERRARTTIVRAPKRAVARVVGRRRTRYA